MNKIKINKPQDVIKKTLSECGTVIDSNFWKIFNNKKLKSK